MFGAVVGDVIGSSFESLKGSPDRNFPLFKNETEALTWMEVSKPTDDTVHTCAVADSILHNKNIVECLKSWTKKYPDAGYGNWFLKWAESDKREGYNSYGNGAVMRISPVPFYYQNRGLDDVLQKTKKITEVTHNHDQGLRAAECISHAIFSSLNGADKSDLKSIFDHYYNVEKSVQDHIKDDSEVKPICQITLPIVISCFMESNDFESVIRNTVQVGGDTDTNCAVVGALAEAYYETNFPNYIIDKTFDRLDIKQQNILLKLYEEVHEV